jgi:gephyrin
MNLNAAAVISVAEAIGRIVRECRPLEVENLPLSTHLIGRTLADDLSSPVSVPSFRASIMDGFAVSAPLNPGIYPIGAKIHAGDNFVDQYMNEVHYITTGAAVPDSANAVVKVENTVSLEGGKVEIKIPVNIGENIREIGSDIASGEKVLSALTTIGPTELGLLATIGIIENIPVYRKPIIGIMSTGNELVEPWVQTSGSQIRDSNRIVLISSFIEEQYQVRDYGIIPDNLDILREKVELACTECDVIISSGGVSMGAKDFIKYLLFEDEKFSPNVRVHFNKLDMKPGKPTTFATIDHSNTKKIFFFGLPGNPVSCLVGKELFVCVALKRLQGLSPLQSLHSEVTITLVGDKDLELDPDRPEYHRVIISHNSITGKLIAQSTGNQRSSRLLSMKSANGLVFLPQGPGFAKIGDQFRALLLHSILPPSCPEDSIHSTSLPDLKLQNVSVSSFSLTSSEWTNIKVGVLTISDRVSYLKRICNNYFNLSLGFNG